MTWARMWEADLLRSMLRYLKADSIVINVGACAGNQADG